VTAWDPPLDPPNPPPDPADPITPMQAADGSMPSGPSWAFEFAWDGIRALAYLGPDRTRLVNASGRLVSSHYPELAELHRLAEGRGPLVLDGTIVSWDLLGRQSATPLRARINNPAPSDAVRESAPVRYFLTDVLYADGRDTTTWPYRERRALLDGLDLGQLPANLPPSFPDVDGQTVLHAARTHGLPGVVAKRLDSRYQPGRRTRAWIQTLPRHEQRVLVGGWRPSPGSPDDPAALLVGVADASGGLRYLGTVTTGLDRAAWAELTGELARYAQRDCPFPELPEGEREGARWLSPRLVGEVSYRRSEPDGRPRQPSWLGLRQGAHPSSAQGPMVLTVPGTTRRRGARREASVELTALDEAVRLAHAENRALRAQISPHFVYNALNAIAVYVRTDPERARDLLHDFAEYTRYSFRPGARTTTLGDELANTRRYLALEKARFGDRLRVDLEVDDDLLDVRLPFLTLQPLVENAVRHGIEGAPNGGTLRIEACRESPGRCRLTVSDDGLGMDPARLTAAVTDVRERLAAAPGPAHSLEVRTAPERGTTVIVRVPLDAGRLDP
jgi:bifunctional non-homologous end joining protein LigD